jgi:hypothetical protein
VFVAAVRTPDPAAKGRYTGKAFPIGLDAGEYLLARNGTERKDSAHLVLL